METAELLSRLCEAPGVSGYETTAREVISEEFRPYADSVNVDMLGNVIAFRAGTSSREPKPRVMLAAHLDEIGLIVTGIEKGFLRFKTVGGFDPRVLPGQVVIVHGARPLPGAIGAAPPHITSAEQRRTPSKIDDMFIDVGLPASEVTDLVSVGDLVSIDRPVVRLRDTVLSGKAMDDRAGVAVIALALRHLAQQKHAWDFYGVATVQEEVGLLGAATSAYGVNPTVAIAIDVFFADMPGTDTAQTVAFGKGPVITFGPNIHPVVFDQVTMAAKRNEIPYQLQAEPGNTGTDAWAIQVIRNGIPTGLIGIPLKYMHTSVETVSTLDVERAARLLASFVQSLDDDFAERLIPPL